METIIKVSPSELNPSLLEKIKMFIGNNINMEVVISLHEYDPVYADVLDHSIEQSDNGDIVSMTMEEFTMYVPKKKQ